MCSSKPKPPKVVVPPPPQAPQAPDTIDKKRRNAANTGAFAAAPGSTLLTGPAGAGKASTGKSTLLGG